LLLRESAHEQSKVETYIGSGRYVVLFPMSINHNPSSHHTIRGDCGEFSCSPIDAFRFMVLAARNETVPWFCLYVV